MVRGRPRKITEKDEELIINQYQLGLNTNEVLGVLNIKSSTYYDYKKANPDFSEQIDYARGNITMIAKVKLAKDMKDSKSKSSLSSAIHLLDRHEGKPMQAVKIDKDSSINIVVKSYKE